MQWGGCSAHAFLSACSPFAAHVGRVRNTQHYRRHWLRFVAGDFREVLAPRLLSLWNGRMDDTLPCRP